jgi:hypothetical protein
VIFLTRQGHRAASYLHGPIFVSKLVLEDDAGAVVTGSLSRLQCDLYPLMNRVKERAQDEGGCPIASVCDPTTNSNPPQRQAKFPFRCSLPGPA